MYQSLQNIALFQDEFFQLNIDHDQEQGNCFFIACFFCRISEIPSRINDPKNIKLHKTDFQIIDIKAMELNMPIDDMINFLLLSSFLIYYYNISLLITINFSLVISCIEY